MVVFAIICVRYVYFELVVFKDYILSPGHLPTVFDSTTHIGVNCKLNVPIRWGDLKKYRGTKIMYEDNQYEIVAIEHYAVSDDRLAYQCGLVLKRMTDDTLN